MRRTLITVVALAVAVPLAAQGGMNMDPTKTITGSGKLPDGWQMRFDPVRAGMAAPAITQISFEKMGAGYHFKSGPAAIYYNAKDQATGEYTVSAKFSQAKSMTHEAYGIFFGGSHLQDSAQKYLYFEVRPMTGGAFIQARSSDARPPQARGAAAATSVFGVWVDDAPGVAKDSPTDGSATNELAVKVGKDVVQFIVNGKVFKELPKSQLNGMSTDGQVGLRINHNLDLQVDGFGIRK